MEWSSFAVTLLIVSSVAAGVTSAVVTTWSLRARAFSIEDRLAVVEGTLQREVKTRAGQERWKKSNKDEELARELLANKNPAPVQRNWWETTLPRSANGS